MGLDEAALHFKSAGSSLLWEGKNASGLAAAAALEAQPRLRLLLLSEAVPEAEDGCDEPVRPKGDLVAAVDLRHEARRAAARHGVAEVRRGRVPLGDRAAAARVDGDVVLGGAGRGELLT